MPEAVYVVSHTLSLPLSGVVTLAAQDTVEVQAKQVDDCAVRGNGTSFVAVRLY